MTVLDKIEEWQKKPEAARRRRLYLLLFIAGLIVVGVGIINFRMTLSEMSASSDTVVGESPLDYLKNFFK